MRVDVFIRASFFSPFLLFSFFFFFNDTATTEIYTLSLHDALPIYQLRWKLPQSEFDVQATLASFAKPGWRSEEHTSELQSQSNLVCRLLLEKKKKKRNHCAYVKKRRSAEQPTRSANPTRNIRLSTA